MLEFDQDVVANGFRFCEHQYLISFVVVLLLFGLIWLDFSFWLTLVVKAYLLLLGGYVLFVASAYSFFLILSVFSIYMSQIICYFTIS